MARPSFAGARLEAAVERQREGRAAEFGRIEPEEEMMHDRIADDRRPRRSRRARRRASPASSPISASIAARTLRGQFGLAAGVHHHVGDAAHQIFAEADLRVHRAGGGDDFAGHEIAQMRGDRGRADVEGDAVGAVAKAGQDGDDLAPLAQGDGDLASRRRAASSAGPRSTLQVRAGLADAPLLAQGLLAGAGNRWRDRACRARATST